MSQSIAKYVTLDIIQTIQNIYADRLDLSTNMFDDEGRTNLVTPSNVTALCGDYVRRMGEGMRACMKSDRQGRVYIDEVIKQLSQQDTAIEKVPPWIIRNQLFQERFENKLIGVAYMCEMGFLDFAVPIFDPEKTTQAADQGVVPHILSVCYGGQYLRGDSSRQSAISSIGERIKKAANVRESEEKAFEKMLERTRQPSWADISLQAHMLYVLGKAIAEVGYDFYCQPESMGKPLPWSRDSILSIYTHAFRIASGARDGCFVPYDRWRDCFDVAVQCDSYTENDCHRKEGKVFRRLVSDQILDYLFVEDTRQERWHIGKPWVTANLVWAVRGYNRETKGLVNLNFGEERPHPTNLAMRLMASLAQQVADFLSMEPLLSRRANREILQSNLDAVLGRLDAVATVQELCRRVASTFYKVHSQNSHKERSKDGDERMAFDSSSLTERPSFQIWLTDEPDFSERELSVGRVLTCCAIDEKFPDPNGGLHIADVPFDPDKFRELLHLPILTPEDLERTYPELRESDAFGREFSNLGDKDHLMILPIRKKGAPLEQVENMMKGLIIIIQPLTEYLTEEGRLVYELFCERLAEVIDLFVERKKQQIALDVENMIGSLSRSETSDETYDQLRIFLQHFVAEVKPTLGLIALSVFMREGWPFRSEQNAPILLLAESNEFPLQQGKPVIKQRSTGEFIPWDKFYLVRYEIGSGCTGWAMKREAPDIVRITNLVEHTRRNLPWPRPSNRYDEALTPERPRYGVIWVKLKSRGEAIGVMRASLRTDGLRLTRHDEEMIRGIANTLSRHIEAMLNQARLERWGNELNAVSRYTQAILELYTSRNLPSPSEKLRLLNWAILLPIASPYVFDISRVQYCLITDSESIFISAGVGSFRPSPDSDTSAEKLRSELRQFFDKYPSSKIDGVSIMEMCIGLARISYRITPRLADQLQEIKMTDEEIRDSVLGEALRSGEAKVIDPSVGSLSHFDARFLKSAQGTEPVMYPFVYVPIASPQLSGRQIREFLYLDNVYRKDPVVSIERAKAIGTFVSILSGLRASENTSYELRDTLGAIGHDIKNVLSVSGRARDSQVAIAVWRCETLQSLSYPVRKLQIERHLGVSNDLDPVLRRVTTYIRQRARDQFASVEVVNPNPPETKERFKGSEILLEAVLWQLMDNALKFTATASGERRLGVELGQDSSDKQNFIHIVVWDTGIGVNEEEKRFLGKEWYRGDIQVEGAGIGLLTCRKLLEQWTGLSDNLNVFDHKPKGSEFHFWIPRAH
jgi:signal transduction histidine kinase